jgi:hypothetical protein
VRYSTIPNWRTSIAVGCDLIEDRIESVTFETVLGLGLVGDARSGGRD